MLTYLYRFKPAHELFAQATHKKLIDTPAREYFDYWESIPSEEMYLDGKTYSETFIIVDVV